jgi:hypothetical protein
MGVFPRSDTWCECLSVMMRQAAAPIEGAVRMQAPPSGANLCPLRRLRGVRQHTAFCFDAADRPVLSSRAAYLPQILPRSQHCYHVNGAGGRHVETAHRLYEQCKHRQQQAARLFADGITIAAKAPERPSAALASTYIPRRQTRIGSWTACASMKTVSLLGNRRNEK